MLEKVMHHSVSRRNRLIAVRMKCITYIISNHANYDLNKFSFWFAIEKAAPADTSKLIAFGCRKLYVRCVHTFPDCVCV